MDLIDRQVAIDTIAEYYMKVDSIDTRFHDGLKTAISTIRDLPSVQLERKRGKWITDKYGKVVCSECKWDAPRIMTGCLANRHLDYDKSDYCWHCGADMKEGDENG